MTPELHRDRPMILRTRWICPNCQELSHTRHWSVQRHIHRKHDGKGEPISINTHQTQTQMNMAAGYFKPYGTSSNSSQLGHILHELSKFVEPPKIPFESRTQCIPEFHKNVRPREQTRNTPDSSQKILTEGFSSSSGAADKQSNTLTSKIFETYLQSQLVDTLMRYLSLLVMTDKGESLIDDILEKLRSNTNPFPEALLRYAKLLDTNLEMIEKRKPLHNHHVKDLPEGVVTKLTQIELLLEPNYHPAVLWDIIEDFIRRVTETREDSVLDTALAEFQMKYQKRG